MTKLFTNLSNFNSNKYLNYIALKTTINLLDFKIVRYRK